MCRALLVAIAIFQIPMLPAVGQLEFSASDDSFVSSSSPTANFGSLVTLVTRFNGNTRYTFLKFDVRDLQGQNVDLATLNLGVRNNSIEAIRAVFAVDDDSWSEGTLTFANQPAIGDQLASIGIGPTDVGDFVSWDITDYVREQVGADGFVSVVVTDPDAVNVDVDFYSKEGSGSHAPLLSVQPYVDAPFVHPGCLFKQSDLDRMASLVSAGVEPYATSFAELQQNSLSSFNYQVRGDESFTSVSRSGGINRNQWESDANAAYLNALMWGITGDTRHADKSVEIFNAWRNITYVGGTGTAPLDSGLFIWKMVEAAEIIRSTYDGWAPADIQAFKDMLVYPRYSDVAIPSEVNNSTVGSFYWRLYLGDPARHGNQDLLAYRGMISMGVFLDNRKIYDRALRYLTSQPGRMDDIPMPTGPSPPGNQLNQNEFMTEFRHLGSDGTIANYGYNGTILNYIFENGQAQESSRDQTHTILGLATIAGMAEVAWNQGDDAWSAHDNRILKGFEYSSRYNTSFLQAFPDQLQPWEPTVDSGEFIQMLDRSGRFFCRAINPTLAFDQTRITRGTFPGNRPIYEQAWAHYNVRMDMGESAVWTERSRDVAISISGLETNGFRLDHAGWGALCFRRPEFAAGDPIKGVIGGVPQFAVHNIPATIEAENYDHFTADGQRRTYFDVTPENTGGSYRDDAVDIEPATVGGFTLTDLALGEWVSYTCNVSETDLYSLEFLYSSESGNNGVLLSSNGSTISSPIILPATGGAWSTFRGADRAPLEAGLHVIRVFVLNGDSNFKLNSFTVANAVLGDVNRDGVVDLLDVQPFVDLILGGLFQAEADMNEDGLVDLLDVSLFVERLL